MAVFRSLNHQFFSTWSPDMAYVLGFFAADGSMVKNKRGAHFIEFAVTDRIILEHIQSVIGSNHCITARLREAPWKTLYRLQLGSKTWFADLSRLGFVQNKGNIMQMPGVPPEFFGDFVRGYFDGDGSVYFKQHHVAARKSKKWIFSSRFTSGSRAFLEELLKSLRRAGLSGGFIVQKNRGYELVFSHRDSLALYGLMYNTVPVTGFCLPRKYELFRTAIETLYPMRS